MKASPPTRSFERSCSCTCASTRRFMQVHHHGDLGACADPLAERDRDPLDHAVERREDHGALTLELGLLEADQRAIDPGLGAHVRAALGTHRSLDRRVRDDLGPVGDFRLPQPRLRFLHREVERLRVEAGQHLALLDPIAGAHRHRLDRAPRLRLDRRRRIGAHQPGGAHGEDQVADPHFLADHRQCQRGALLRRVRGILSAEFASPSFFPHAPRTRTARRKRAGRAWRMTSLRVLVRWREGAGAGMMHEGTEGTHP